MTKEKVPSLPGKLRVGVGGGSNYRITGRPFRTAFWRDTKLRKKNPERQQKRYLLSREVDPSKTLPEGNYVFSEGR